MILLPAIDLYAGKAVRLLRGDYEKMTVYGENAAAFAAAFADAGAEWVHMVDLEGAKSGTTPNFETVAAVAGEGKLHQQAVHAVIGIERPDFFQERLFRGFFRQYQGGVPDAARLAGLGLVAHVHHAGGVFAHTHNHQMRHAPVFFRERSHLLRQPLFNGGRNLFSVDEFHRCKVSQKCVYLYV